MPLEFPALRHRVLIAAGDTRAELVARGWDRPDFCELANLEKPDAVRDIADAFLDAGIDVLVTMTESANVLAQPQRPKTEGLTSERAAEICRRGAEVCRQAVAEFPAKGRYVFGAIGPVQQLRMLDEISESDLAAAYEAQARSLADGGVDALVLRGFAELAALQIAVRAARATILPVIATMAFDAGPDQTETTLGVSVPQMCAALMEPVGQVSQVGQASLPANPSGLLALGCDGQSPDSAAKVVALLRQSAPDIPIWCALDAGHPQLIDNRAVYPESPEDFAARAKTVVAAGANILAGRRGATPAHLAALAKALCAPKRRPR
ncbi:MAG TPA: homocysteine S-methyltransferase family protein [Phycisphaerae bacterium]|nr:homocysteine S-methyltransferase family protein [Phycisphaerae bacterium]